MTIVNTKHLTKQKMNMKYLYLGHYLLQTI